MTRDDGGSGPGSGPGADRHTRLSFGRFVATALLWLIRGYQLVISPLTPPSCRYYPSCSAYALTALERHGPLRGSWLAVRRIGRCHPWSAGGVDHVPPLPGHAPDDHRLPEDREPIAPGTFVTTDSSDTLPTSTLPTGAPDSTSPTPVPPRPAVTG